MPTSNPASAPYALKTVSLAISAEIALQITCIKDLDTAVDQLCANVPTEAGAEARTLELSPYYGVPWASGLALAQHLAKMGGFLKGKTVLELGCGLALPSIVAAKLGARVTAIDFHPDVPKLLETNCTQNGVQVEFALKDWRSGGMDLGSFDFVIGSDILYESSHPDSIAREVTAHCHRESHILLADPGRAYLQLCVDAIAKRGYRQDMFIRTTQDQDLKMRDVFLFSFQRAVS